MSNLKPLKQTPHPAEAPDPAMEAAINGESDQAEAAAALPEPDPAPAAPPAPQPAAKPEPRPPVANLAIIPKASPLTLLGARFNIDPAKLMEVLRGTVIKPTKDGRVATNEEVAAFVVVANQYGLNPFTREIHAFSDPQKGVVPIVGIDGWVHLVNQEPKFDGVAFDERTAEDGAPVSVTCRMSVKGRANPVEVTEHMAECKRNTIPWQTMPRRMLRHKAYIQAARYAFGLSGLYDEDEARDIIANATPVAGTASEPRPLKRGTTTSEVVK